MILQSLVRYYDRLATEKNKLPPYGWSFEKISYCIVLNEDGSIYNIESMHIKEEVKNDKKDTKKSKIRLLPRPMLVPMYPEGRTSGVKANYLWDNTAYVLGLSEKPKASEKYQDFWQKVLTFDATNSSSLQTLVKFYKFWNETDKQSDKLPADFELDSNVIFRCLADGNRFVYQCPEFKKQWQIILEKYQSTLSTGQCLIEGTQTNIADLHVTIKNVDGAQSSGAYVVSFNKDSFESYGLKSGKNASVGTNAAFKYVTALNYLLRKSSDNRQRLKIGDAVTLFWAEAFSSEDAELAEAFGAEIIDSETGNEKPTDGQEAQSLAPLLEQISNGRPLKELRPDLQPDTKFYVLGLSPNAARLAIRFWYATTLDELAKHLAAHYHDLHLEPQFDNGLPKIWQLVYATAPIRQKNGQLKTDAEQISPQLAGNLARAIFTGQHYPQSLLTQVLLRMRSDGVVNHTRVSLCKAVINREIRLNQKTTQEIPMSLDIEEKNAAYRMGRLFAVIEEMQKKALGEEIKATIRDRYWGAASATPALVFPMLERNMMNHLSKIRKTESYPAGKDKPPITGQKLAGFLDWQIGQIKEGMETYYPKNLNLQEQGRFAIGYYHQRFTRKIKTKTGEVLDNLVAADTDVSAQNTDAPA